jgi:GTP-binding protein
VTRKPTVAIVGRPNVGKSALFNRIAGRRIAVTEETPGITRDRLYADCEWRGKPFTLVDTGGLDFGSEPMVAAIRQQVEFAVDEADVILFVVDAKDGLAGLDHDIAQRLRKTGKPVVLVANKADGRGRLEAAQDSLALRLGEPLAVSALHGIEIGTLLERLDALLPEATAEQVEDEKAIRVAIVGHPNVGKSSLLNALMGEQRVVVSPLPGTTRDAIDTPFSFAGKDYVMIDTAGIRRKSRVGRSFEYYSVLRALNAIERCHVCILVLDAVEGLTDQDIAIARYADKEGRGQVLAVNKWDLRLEAAAADGALTTREQKLLENDVLPHIRERLPFMNFAPLVFISATKPSGLDELMKNVQAVADQHSARIPTAMLNRAFREAVAAKSLSRRGKPLRIYNADQPGTRPPTIIMYVNDPALLHFSDERYLENRLRKAFSLDLTPLRLIARQSSGKEAKARK